MADEGSHPLAYTGYYDDECRRVHGVVPVEEVIALHVNGQPLVRLMCTPVLLEELALGFLFNEGLIEEASEVEEVKVLALSDGQRWLDIWLGHEIEAPKLRTITSGCSGGTTFESAGSPVESDLRVTPRQVTHLMAGMSRSAELYHRAGGLHMAALAEGEVLVCLAEDIGRHNAVDKIAGLCLRQGLPMKDRVLLSSGRISSEVVNKAARMQVPVIVSRTSPTSLSVQLAQAWHVTLIGYTRRRSFRVYAGEERVLQPVVGGSHQPVP
ncbi:MAG: formate dehydrogenase accessory sulfurtransferase FdhD [Anaerolineae bacterium]|nr:formate dehydrogenase accessory sulfurtransferase FdhD [Anaerolineae bacterium]